MSTLTTRRTALRNLLQVGMGAAALPLLGTRHAFGGGSASQCPGADTGISWVPDVMHPVAAGFEDLGVSDGAPGPVRVWYPTAELEVVGRPAKFLNHCTARWPVVLFLHGQQPCPDTQPRNPDYFKSWTHIPAQLARSGYVVLVPAHPQDLSLSTAEALRLSGFIDWARTSWQNALSLDQRPEAVAIAGHSRGAVHAAFVAQVRGEVSAFVSLGGVWDSLANDTEEMLAVLDKPTFFEWVPGVFQEDLDGGHRWDQLNITKYACMYPGEHFDYIDMPAGCNEPVGPCRVVKLASADLVTLFLSRYLPVAASRTRIQLSLLPPDVPLTDPKQLQFATRRLEGLDRINRVHGCSMDLRFRSGLIGGTVHFGGQ